MLALFSTVFVLFGAPAILLYAGRLIRSATDPAHRAAARQRSVLTGDEWFCRAPRSLSWQGTPDATPAAEPVWFSEPAANAGEEWFFRPMPPLVVWPDFRPFRRFRRTASV